jgi:hypothetical protein
MQEEGMHRRFTAGRKGVALSLILAGVLLVSVTGAFAAARPEATVKQPESGFQAKTEEVNTLRKTTFARSNYAWPFAAGPYYGDVAPQDKRASGVMVTPVGSFYLSQGGLNFPAELKNVNRLGVDLIAQYFVVQVDLSTFEDGRWDALKAQIETNGGQVMQVVPMGSFITRLTPGAMTAISGQPGVLAIEPYHGAFKLHPTIGRMPLFDRQLAISEVYSLDVMVFEGEDVGALAATIAEMGGNVTNIMTRSIEVDVHRSLLPALAALEPVQMIYEHQQMFANDHEGAAAMEIGFFDNSLNPGDTENLSLPYHQAGVRGQGQVAIVLDSGYSADAMDLSHTRTDAGDIAPGFGPSHRKILRVESTNQYGGSGDTLGCDAPASGGFSHGHTVAAAALGWGTDTSVSYGGEEVGVDDVGNEWSLNGVAPEAKLVALDARVTPAVLPCAATPGISPGTYYDGGSCDSGNKGAGGGVNAHGSLCEPWRNDGADTANYSFGGSTNVYDGSASQIDDFIFDTKGAMVFVSAGNSGADLDGNGSPDPGTIASPATCKNCLSIGATGHPNDLAGGGADEDDRAGFTSAGPTPQGRIKPELMAPGTDFGTQGLDGTFNCRSNDNNLGGPVICDVIEGASGTSFASPNAMGAGLLVRSYFANGFYPDGTDQNPGNGSDQVAQISGALMKAVLIASADWVGEGNDPPSIGPSLPRRQRFNNEQGYGRIQLNNALPLQAYAGAAVGLVVIDGDGTASGLGLDGNVASGETDTTTFDVCDPTQEVRVALAWVEPNGDALINDLNLEVEDPSGNIYWGNYYTDDNDRSRGVPGAGEDCPGIDGTTGSLDESPWSLPTCVNSIRDTENPTEAVHLSPDADADGDDDADFNQIEGGAWPVRVIGGTFGGGGTQNYAVAISGGVCAGSNVRFLNPTYPCNGAPEIVINETDETTDPGTALTPAVISARTTVEVVDPGADGNLGGGDDTVVDTETGLTFIQPDPSALSFRLDGQQIAMPSPIAMSDGLAADPGNGALDVVNGHFLRVIYRDESTAIPGPDPDQERRNSARVDCQARISFGDLVFGQFGLDTPILVEGGCEENQRGKQEFGFPDRSLDAGELIGYRFAFASAEAQDLDDVVATLRCVQADGPGGDSPADCRPGTQDCPDPNRENNPDCSSYLTILDSPKLIGDLPSNAAISANFNIQMEPSIAGEPEVEFLIGITSSTAGKTAQGLAVTRTQLDTDAEDTFYSTDFRTGGSESQDWDNNELLEGTAGPTGYSGVPTENLGDFNLDYRFENRVWADMTACIQQDGNPVPGGCNLNLGDWDFDTNDGNFTVGRGAISDVVADIVANWGEDLNFNGGAPETDEDRDPMNGQLDNNWSTLGGCGWQTLNAGDSTGGVWHTGGIRQPGQATCLAAGGNAGDCQQYETLTGINAQASIFELLQTPKVQKVDKTLDANGLPVKEVELLDWSWNAELDIPDPLALVTWEFDTDADAAEPVDLTGDGSVFNLFGGGFGAVTGGSNVGLTDGYPVFAPLDGTQTNSQNGSVGTNRSGDNSCFFEGGAVSSANAGVLGLSDPPDDDIDQNAGGGTDEYVTDQGPLRNFDMGHFNGLDMRFTVFSDLYGASGESFQGALGFFIGEGDPTDQPLNGFGVAIDNVVMRWRETRTIADATDCAGGGGICATLELQTTNFYEGNSLLTVTALEGSPDPAGNDCDLDGNPDVPLNTDCDNDGTTDIVVEASCDTLPFDKETVYLNQVGTSDQYTGAFPISAVYDVDGTLFCGRNGTDLPTVTVDYLDNDNGTGSPCDNDVDPAASGIVSVGTVVLVPSGRAALAGIRLTDNGDNDGFCDTNETCNLFVTINNQTGLNLEGVTARLSTNSPDIECIQQPVVTIGSLDPTGPNKQLEGPDPFVFKVLNTTNRAGAFDDLSAEFTLSISSSEFDATIVPQVVTIDLDLNVTGGLGPTNFTEGFDVGGSLGSFTSMTLDDVGNDGSNAASDRYRCQFNDPDFINANSYGETQCYLGNSVPIIQNSFDWHQHSVAGGTAPDLGRAFEGTGSLHFGIHQGGDPDLDTAPLATLDAVRSTNPINLGYTGLAGSGDPELRFKHQISLVDNRSTNTPAGEAVDRGVVQVQFADTLGSAVGDWVNLEPFQNSEDAQGTDNFVDCLFDPIDDGNDEDSFFDPTDPDRRTGPSSTCFPSQVFNFVGDIDYRNVYNAASVGRATDPDESFQGIIDRGTWMESKFDMSRFAGRRVRLRFVESAIEVNDIPNYESAFVWNPVIFDDGWYIDSIVLANTLTSPATVSADGTDNSLLPGCGSICTTLTAGLTATPTSTPAPGGATELDASSSSADSCLDGTLQFAFYEDVDKNGVIDGSDTLLRDWTDNPLFLDAPSQTTGYAVQSRCSSDTACGSVDQQFAFVTVTVLCPSSGALSSPFTQSVTASSASQFSWGVADTVDVYRGNLAGGGSGAGASSLTGTGSFLNTVETCLQDDQNLSSFTDATTPTAAGDGVYYLVRSLGGAFCNQSGSWNSTGANQVGSRDADINGSANACP